MMVGRLSEAPLPPSDNRDVRDLVGLEVDVVTKDVLIEEHEMDHRGVAQGEVRASVG
jgi:hypothetical protein